ncbi:MAG: CBS domain-containing protein [Desulfobulbaceae bacterium]|nr:CBS domain-containing protein [Desulfobulbaceae bacterium]
MEKWHVAVLLLAGLGLLAISVLVRMRYGERYELKTIDFVLIIIPLLFVLLITGKVKVLDAFGVKADLSELFADAAGANIEQQVVDTSSPDVDEVVNMLEMATKGGVKEIPQLVQKKTEALVFRLGHGGYYGPAIQQYFDALYASSYLQYLIVLNQEGKLFAIYDALDLAVYFRTEGEQAYHNFASWLNQPNESSQRELTHLPGFVNAKQAVARELSKREVLKRMDSLRVDSLPVVDDSGFFVGTVERSLLTASLILEVVDRLEPKTAGND